MSVTSALDFSDSFAYHLQAFLTSVLLYTDYESSRARVISMHTINTNPAYVSLKFTDLRSYRQTLFALFIKIRYFERLPKEKHFQSLILLCDDQEFSRLKNCLKIKRSALTLKLTDDAANRVGLKKKKKLVKLCDLVTNSFLNDTSFCDLLAQNEASGRSLVSLIS